MCNLYSMTANREAIISLFKVSDNRAAAIEPKPAIFPSNDAPVVRRAADGARELVELSWGFVLTMKDRAPKRVTNVRDDKLDSRFWAASFRERRCLVPVTSFAEPKGRSPAIWHWFALGQTRCNHPRMRATLKVIPIRARAAVAWRLIPRMRAT